MENIYDKVLLMKKYKLSGEQTVIENNITIEETADVVKILAGNSSVDIDRPLEALNGECNVSGKIVCNLVYLTENGEVNNQTSVSPFSYKIKDANITAGAKLNVFARAVGQDINRLSGNQLKVLTTLDFDGVVIKKDEVNYLKGGDQNTYLKQQEREIVSFSGAYCEKFEESLSATVKGGVKKVLMTNVDFVLKDWTSGPNFVSIEGELYSKVLYVDKNDPSELQTITISKNVKQEIEVAGINKDSDLDIFALTIKEKIEVTLSENETDTEIVVNSPIMVCTNVYEKNKILSVVDLYSSKDILSIQNDEQENYFVCKPEYIEGKIEGNVVLGDDEPRIDKYLTTTNICANISNSYVKDGAIYLEGILLANVIYLNDEKNEIMSVQIEVPFVLDKKTDLHEDVIVEATLGVTDADTMVKRGREIYFDARIKAFINICKKENFDLITKVDSVGVVPEKNDAIELYFGKSGESFWDIAKNLKIPSEVIRSQNPDLSDPLEKDQNIALYFQKIRNK